MKSQTIYIGTAGWNIPAHLKAEFRDLGSHLKSYAGVFNCVEINSSFYRDHRRETYERWASSVPHDFRFSVKLSRYFTQETRLRETGERLQDTIDGISGLGSKWAVLLIQLPPSLEFDLKTAAKFGEDLKKRLPSSVEAVWEPRHTTWVDSRAIRLMSANGFSKAIADPERCRLTVDQRRLVEGVHYLRLHGSPEIYKSRYTESMIELIKTSLTHPLVSSRQTWCIFDNTTFGYATENARELMRSLTPSNLLTHHASA